MLSPAEVRRALVGDLEIAYETLGEATDPPVVLISGLGGQLISWDDDFCQELDRPRSVRHPVRQPGCRAVQPPRGGPDRGRRRPRRDLHARPTWRPTRWACSDHLGLRLGPRGGVVAGRDDRADPGDRAPGAGPQPDLDHVDDRQTTRWVRRPEAAMAPAADGSGRIRGTTRMDRARPRATACVGSPAYRAEESLLARASGAGLRSRLGPRRVWRDSWPRPSSTPDRTEDLRRLDLPTLVIHGAEDPLIAVSGGRATAEAIPGAELVVIEGMGHELPKPLWPTVAERVAALVRRTEEQRGVVSGASPKPEICLTLRRDYFVSITACAKVATVRRLAQHALAGAGFAAVVTAISVVGLSSPAAEDVAIAVPAGDRVGPGRLGRLRPGRRGAPAGGAAGP